jgi:hypothetical protein
VGVSFGFEGGSTDGGEEGAPAAREAGRVEEKGRGMLFIAGGRRVEGEALMARR